MKFKIFFDEFVEGQRLFGETISTIVNTILLTLVYSLGVGLTSITAKIFNKSFLDIKIEPKKITYWQDLNLTKKPMEDYFRQF